MVVGRENEEAGRKGKKKLKPKMLRNKQLKLAKNQKIRQEEEI